MVHWMLALFIFYFKGAVRVIQDVNARFTVIPLKAVFRIRIRSDPYHLVGSGSVSGNVDMDPGSAKN